MDALSMRDAFFERLYEIATKDKNVYVVSADVGASGLDKFKSQLPGQWISVGTAEQNMVTVATGLALSGKKVFTYAMAPSVTARCLEMIKVNFSLMNLPVTMVGVGAGFSHEDSGPTHHSTEDISFMRVLPNMTLLNASDSRMAWEFANLACQISGPSYIRLDQGILPIIYGKPSDFSKGLSTLKNGRDLWIIASGNMVHRALEVAGELADYRIDAGVVDLYRLKPVNTKPLLAAVGRTKRLITLEEHLLAGGIGSIVAETLADGDQAIPLKRIGIQDKYYYAYGGRENIQRLCGLDKESVIKTILESMSPYSLKSAQVEAAVGV